MFIQNYEKLGMNKSWILFFIFIGIVILSLGGQSRGDPEETAFIVIFVIVIGIIIIGVVKRFVWSFTKSPVEKSLDEGQKELEDEDKRMDRFKESERGKKQNDKESKA